MRRFLVVLIAGLAFGGPLVMPAAARPRITGVSISPSTFAVSAVAAGAAHRVTTIRFRLSSPATLKMTIGRKARGRRSGGRCVKATRRLRHRPACTRYATLGKFDRGRRKAGRVAVPFSGQVRGHALRPGTYRATIVAIGSRHRRSRAKHARFIVTSDQGGTTQPPQVSPPPPSAPPIGGDCQAAANCFPKPSNTGVGATGVPPGHAPAPGCTTNPASGAVLTDCLFAGTATLTTTGAGATYRFSRFQGQVIHRGAGTLTVEYSDLGPTSGCQTYDDSFLGANYTVRYSRFNSHVGEGPRVSDSNILIEENFIGPMCSNPGDHADGIQGYQGGTNILIRHNTVDIRPAQYVTSAIFIADDSQSARVEDNLAMGGGYTIRLHDDFTPDHGPWTLLRNRIVDGAWGGGPMTNTGTTFTASTCSDNRLVTIDTSYNVTSVGALVRC